MAVAARCKLFGEIAVARGLCTREQIDEALRQQTELKAVGIHKTLGAVLHDMEALTLVQVNKIMEDADNTRRRHSIEGYEIISKLGRGGMGAVYLARQLSLNKLVAVKVLPPKLAQNRDYLTRFRSEAAATAKLNHRNIVAAFDVGESNGYHYFVMEYVEGETLRDILDKSGIIDEDRAIDQILQIADGLDHAWGHGIVHRDIKPANIMVAKDGTPKLCDLGLAIDCNEDRSITRSGVIMGTPYYLSPEQARSERLDCRSDIYSLGATLFHMVTGHVPYQGDTPAIVITKHLNEPTPDPLQVNPVLSEGLCYVIRRMMAKEPEHRYQSPQELATDLRELQGGGTLSRRVLPGDGPRARARAAVMRRLAVGAAILGPAMALVLLAALDPEVLVRAKARALSLIGRRGEVIGKLRALKGDDETPEQRARRREAAADQALEEAERRVALARDDVFAARAALAEVCRGYEGTRAAERAKSRLDTLSERLDVEARALFFRLAVEARTHRQADRFAAARRALEAFPKDRFGDTSWWHQAQKEIEITDQAARERFEELLEEARAMARDGRHREAQGLLAPALAFGVPEVEGRAGAEIEALRQAERTALEARAAEERTARARRFAEALGPVLTTASEQGLRAGADAARRLARGEVFAGLEAPLATLAQRLEALAQARDRELERLRHERGQEVTLVVSQVRRRGIVEDVRGDRVHLKAGRNTFAYPFDTIDAASWLTAEAVGSELEAAELRHLLALVRGHEAEAKEALAEAEALGADVSLWR